MIKFIKQHINSLMWALIIMMLCGAPTSSFPTVRFLNIPHLDKVVHFVLYFVFTLLLVSENNTLRLSGGITKKSMLIGFILAVAYGGIIELMQMLVFTSRGAEIVDFLANFIGSITAILCYKLLNKLSRRLI